MSHYPIDDHIKELLSENPALSVFLNAVREFGGIIEPQSLFEHVLNVCIKIFKAEGGSVMLFSGEEKELVIKSSEGLKAEIIEKYPFYSNLVSFESFRVFLKVFLHHRFGEQT